MPWAMAAHRPLGDPIATVATPVPKTSTRATRSFWLVILPAVDPQDLAEPGHASSPGEDKSYNGTFRIELTHADGLSVPSCMLDAWSPSSRRYWRTTRPGSRRPRRPSAWTRTSSSRSCRTGSTAATRPCTWPRPGSGTPRPGAARRRYPRQRGQPARCDGVALRLRSAAAVASLGPACAQRRIIELLISAGAAVDQPDRGGVTALHRAVRARSPAAVAALLSAVR